MTNESVDVIEKRHNDLGLKDLGGTEISERLFLVSWQICGDEYVLLDVNGIIRDVLKFPPHSKLTPQFIGTCEIRGHQLPDSIIAVLDNKEGDAMIPAKFAWKIDETRMKLITFPVEGLLCPKRDVITADGGL